MSTNKRTIYLAGGCFWGMQQYFAGVHGVLETEVGYANTLYPNPRYEDIDSDYAETLRIVFDAEVSPLQFILDLYFDVIDPTSLNRQGGDVGRQYRTGIYYIDEEDESIIRKSLDKLQERYLQPIVVESLPLTNFYSAEEYHQDYLRKNPGGYCHIGRDKIVKAQRKKYVDVDALRARLSPIQFHVTQENGTEPPFHNEYFNHFERGIYVDVIDGTPLFSSDDKFESGCGWPAFTKPLLISSIAFFQDDSCEMRRTEVRSKGSGAHLGHVFDDAPMELGGERYCINSASLRFIPIEKMIAEGYEKYLPYVSEGDEINKKL